MICKFCQAQIEDGASVCPVCNRDLTEESLEAAAETAQPIAEEAETAEVSAEVCPQEVPAEAAAEETCELPREVNESAVEAVEESAPRKRTTKIIALVCSIVLALGLGFGIWYAITDGFGGGFGKDDVMVKTVYAVEGETAAKSADKVIAKVGDKTLTNRQLQVYYWMEVMNFVQQNQYYLSYYGMDPVAPLSEQYITEGGLTWEQYFLDNALSNWHYYQCLVIEAEKQGYTLSDTLSKSIDNMFTTLEYNALSYGYSSVDELLAHDLGAIANSQAYRDYIEMYYGGMEFFSDIYDSVDPTREEAENYYNVHGAEVEETYGVNKSTGLLVDVRHILVAVKTSGTDENGTAISTEEDWANCLSDAEKILATWEQGAASEDSFALLANTFSEDPGSNTTGGLYTFVAQGQMVKTFDAWCFDPARKAGDVGIVKTEFGYHIIYYVNGEEGWLRRSEQMLIEATCTEMLAGYMEANPLLVKYKDIVLSAFSLFG